jgi:hypothetical protein
VTVVENFMTPLKTLTRTQATAAVAQKGVTTSSLKKIDSSQKQSKATALATKRSWVEDVIETMPPKKTPHNPGRRRINVAKKDSAELVTSNPCASIFQNAQYTLQRDPFSSSEHDIPGVSIYDKENQEEVQEVPR